MSYGWSLLNRTTKVILSVLSVSIMCGMPNAIINIIMCITLESKPITSFMYSTTLTTNAIVYFGSAINPIVYSLLRRDIR